MNATLFPATPDDLPAGRLLDAAIAERIGGFRWYVSNSTGKRALFHPNQRPDWFTRLAKGTEPHVGDDPYVRVPHYSTNVSDALRLVEMLAEHGVVRLSNGDGDSRDFDFMPFNALPGHSGFVHAHVSAESWPLAVARVAYLATEVGPHG